VAAKLTESDVREIRAALARGHTQEFLAGRHGVSRSLIRLIGRRERWTHVV